MSHNLLAIVLSLGVVIASLTPVTAGTTFKRQYVTGLSSGAFAAVQYHVAFSSEIDGLAIFSGGPYLCAQGVLDTAQNVCLYGEKPIDLSTLEGDASTLASSGSIDPLSNLKNSPVWIFHGTSDYTVPAATNAALAQQYQDWGANVVYNSGTDANHAWISPSGANPCTNLGSPYINNCPNEAADPENDFLTHLLGAAPNAASSSPSGQLTTMSQDSIAQSLFQQDASAFSMDTNAYLYTPTSCASSTSTCSLIIVLHGCVQGYSSVGSDLIDQSNLQGYADTNSFVLLFPQAIVTSGSNPESCWDWWSYTGSSGDYTYATKKGPQMAIINGLVGAIGSNVKNQTSIQLIANE